MKMRSGAKGHTYWGVGLHSFTAESLIAALARAFMKPAGSVVAADDSVLTDPSEDMGVEGAEFS